MATKTRDADKSAKAGSKPAVSKERPAAASAAGAKAAKAPAAKAKVAKVAAPAVESPPKAAAPARRKSVGKTTLPAVSDRQRGHYIEVAAYFIAERRGFAAGDTVADWLEAEGQVDRLIAEGKLGS